MHCSYPMKCTEQGFQHWPLCLSQRFWVILAGRGDWKLGRAGSFYRSPPRSVPDIFPTSQPRPDKLGNVRKSQEKSGIVGKSWEMSGNKNYENNRFLHIGKFSHFETIFRRITCQERSGNAIKRRWRFWWGTSMIQTNFFLLPGRLMRLTDRVPLITEKKLARAFLEIPIHWSINTWYINLKVESIVINPLTSIIQAKFDGSQPFD